MSQFGVWYQRIYDALCGKHPHTRPWHFQWIDNRFLHHKFETWMSETQGPLLDVGCSDKPFQKWVPEHVSYTGLDVGGTIADIIVKPGEKWPINDGSFQTVLCTKVLSDVKNPPSLFQDIH